MGNHMKRGVSLYSYQDEFYTGKMNLEDCFKALKEAGATGVEFLPEQMIPGFPEITDEFVEEWNRLLKKYDLVAIAYDAFLETKLFPNRELTKSESITLLKRDLKLANKLGCTILRTLVSTPTEVIKDCLDYAEEMNVKIALEVHSPFTFGTPWFEERLDFIKESKTKWFGIMPDLGIFVKEISPVMKANYIRRGANPQIVNFVSDSYRDGLDKQETLESVKNNKEATEIDIAFATLATHFVYTDPNILKENIDYIVHVHGKFYEVNEDLVEESIPYKEVLKVLVDAGFDGYICSEYEGNRHIQDFMEVDSITQVNRHQKMMKAILDSCD